MSEEINTIETEENEQEPDAVQNGEEPDRQPAEEPAGTEPESGESDNTEPDKEPSDEEEALYQILVKSSALNVRNNPSYESRVIGTLFRKETRLVAE